MVEWASKAAEKINKAIKTVQEANKEFDGFANVIKLSAVEAFRQLIEMMAVFVERMTIVNPILKLIGVDVNKLSENLQAQIDQWQANSQAALQAAAKITAGAKGTASTIIDTNKDVGDSDAEVVRKRKLAAKELAKLKKEEEKAAAKAAKEALLEIEAANKLHFDVIREDNRLWRQEQDEAQQKWVNLFTTSTADMTDFAVSQINTIFTSFGQGIADVILEGKNFKDVMTDIFKSLARAIIAQISAMIAKLLIFLALRAATGGQAFAGTSIADVVGFAQGGGFIGEPSIVRGLRSGKTMAAGEAGAEAIVPLGGMAQGTNRPAPGIGAAIGAGGGGTNITVNISGQFIEGNEAKWQNLIRSKIVPEIRRFTMVTPVGPFTRRRGATI